MKTFVHDTKKKTLWCLSKKCVKCGQVTAATCSYVRGPILVVGTHPRVVCARLCGSGIGFLGHRSPPGADVHHKIQARVVDRVFREHRNGD